MKKTLKSFFVLAVAAMGFAACSNDELIPSKDTYGGYKGVTDDYAYIVGGTMPEYDAVTAEIQHTTIGELGEINRTFEVALTKAQATGVTITLGVDNDALTGSYSAFPEGFLKYESTVTIPAGETKATVSVTADNADFPRLTEPSYMAVFRILDATGVEVSTNSNKALLYATTETIDPANNIIALTAGAASFNITNYTNETVGNSISARMTITGSEPAFQPFDITLKVDNSLIAAYNAANGTAYEAVPDGLVDLPKATMAKDATSTNVTLSIADGDRSKLTGANGYLIPVVIENASPATLSENSGIYYVTIQVVNFDYASDMFSALYLGDYRMATWYQFQKPIDCGVDDGYTIVMHIFIDEVTNTARIGDWADKDENWINMLRFGQYGQGNTILDWFVGPNGARKNVRTKEALPVKQWVQLAFVYDNGMYGEDPGYYLYVDGELNNSVLLSEADQAAIARSAKPTFQFQAIEFNSSWGANYRRGNEFHGRLWRVAVFPSNYSWYLTSAYGAPYLTRDNIDRYAAAMIQQWLGGQGAYWPMDEGFGHILKEKSGFYESVDFSKTVRCDDEVSMVPADVSQYVQWKADEYNILK